MGCIYLINAKEDRAICVIAIVDKTRITDDMVEKMYSQNSAGAGIAWRRDGEVFWEKGLDLEHVKTLCQEAPLPFVVHFRIPTCGGPLKSLCHPFGVDKQASTELNGKTKGYVLFHNGHWGQWKDKMLEACIKKNIKMPDDKWSDSRAMAWMAYNYGISVLDMIDEKCVLFGPNKIQLINHQQFSRVNDCLVSNRMWESSGVYNRRGGNDGMEDWSGYYGGSYGRPLCLKTNCMKPRMHKGEFCVEHAIVEVKEETGGSLAAKDFREGVVVTETGEDKQQKVQEIQASVRGDATGNRAGSEKKEAKAGESVVAGTNGITALVPTSMKRLPPHRVTESALEALRWVRGLNPKKYPDGSNGIHLVGITDAEQDIDTRVM